MALTSEEEKFYRFAKDALPPWVPDGDEFLMGAAKMFGSVKALIDYLFGNALIGTAEGATATTPDWLNQHASDRGSGRRSGEDDPTLRARIRSFSDALTRAVLISSMNEILAAAGVSGTSAIVELPQHGAHYGDYGMDFGSGGTFTKAGSVMTFTPDTGWARPPYWAPTLVPARGFQFLVTTAASVGNEGPFTSTGVVGDAVQYTNAGGVAEVDATCDWELYQLDGEGNIRSGFKRSYYGRGYRYARRKPPRMIVILPYGSTQAVEDAVLEMLRTKKAAGIAVSVERRLTPP